MSTTGETFLPVFSCPMKVGSEAVEGGIDVGMATMLQKSEPSGFRITSVICHPAESATSVISWSVLSLPLKNMCICSILRIIIWRGE